MSTTRRRLLQVGLGGAALLAVGGVGVALRPGVLRAPSAPLQALDPRSFSTLAAVADAVCPGTEVYPSAAGVGVAEGIDALLASCDPGMTDELTQALMLLENALVGLLLDGRPVAFTALSPATQAEVFEGWRTSRIGVRRQIYKALRGLCASVYYAHPDTWPGSGYPGPPDYAAAAPAEATP